MAIALITARGASGAAAAFRQQVLFYPVTDASFDTGSYQELATGYFLRRDAMQWFWDQYTTDPPSGRDHRVATARDAQQNSLRCRPTLVITGEADVLRDEGEALRRQAEARPGVPVTAVRFQGIIHDFVMLNALAQTQAARGAMALAIDTLRQALRTA